MQPDLSHGSPPQAATHPPPALPGDGAGTRADPAHAADAAAAADAAGPDAPSQAARHGPPAVLAGLLQAARRDTLARFAAWQAALPDLQVPRRETLNPPLWELGHIGWFQHWWIGRNPQRARGLAADPEAPRRPGRPANADALYDSSRVPHASRWSLPLPDATATQAELAAQLDETLALLAALPADADDAALYFFRLALLHEDMHHEAALYMARAQGLALADARWQPRALPAPGPAWPIAAGLHRFGRSAQAPGFAFDNECGAAEAPLVAATIDAQVLRWAEFLPFVEAGGYAEAHWWSAAGWQRLQAEGQVAPKYLRREGSAWLEWRLGRWHPLQHDHAAVHLSLHEAEAWCRWAQRRLPTEAEWEHAALHAPPGCFRWGEVWEWTATAFGPWPGFQPHPYRDYSAPWFDGRPVLRGASFLTQPRLRDVRYRNFFPAHRHDVPAGFRSCSLGAG